MELTITLPEHVAALFVDADDAAAVAEAALTAEAKARTLAAVSADVQRTLAEAAAPFDGVEPPTGLTLAERVEQIAGRSVRLGVELAVEAGVTPERATEIVAAVIGEPGE